MTTEIPAQGSRVTDIFGASCPVGVRVDARSGLATALVHRTEARPPVPIEIALTLVTGGTEEVGPIGGLIYADTDRTRLTDLEAVSATLDDEASGGRYVVEAASGDWRVALEYRFTERPPHVAFGFTLRRASGAPAILLRDVELAVRLPLDDPADWVLNAPGNQLRADLGVDELEAPIRIFSAGDSLGSPAIVALSRRSEAETVVVWPVCRTEVGAMDLDANGSDASLTIRTGLAGRVVPAGAGLTWRVLHLDAVSGAWPDVRGALPAWYEQLEVRAPADAPTWIQRAHIYEAHVGFSVFAGGERYERYATVAEIEADLPRIRGLGFDVIQLMPRHPYPSYNVHDYADVTTTYGDEAEVRSLVASCHKLGIRVLLDVILHGVVDKEVVDATVALVHAGPYAARLDDGAIDYLSRTAEDVAWSRHIVEYAPHWRAGSPARHPLADERPEWFMRDSAGTIARRYTKAFDIAEPAWQQYFIDACVDLVERLGIDGFRVDAPTYNQFASWEPERAARASYGPMASLGLLRELRTRLRAAHPDVAIYTEPTGGLFRAVADATYNYDEHWLIEALLGPAHPEGTSRLVRDARELGRWLQERDAAIPPGSAIIHHIDSHDSIWWRLPGAQWRRERFGRDAAVALLAVFSLTGGGFMTFMGGEDAIEDDLRRAHDLRRQLPELDDGSVDYEAATASSDAVLTVVRAAGPDASLVAVNLTGEPVECDVRVRDGRVGSSLHDLWNDEHIAVPAGAETVRLGFEPFQPRVLRLRPDNVVRNR